MNKVIWLTGLSGSGKTAIANQLITNFAEQQHPICIDGDFLRSVQGNQDFSIVGRQKNVQDAITLCEQNPDVPIVVSLITPFNELRNLVRTRLKDRYVEVYLKCSIEECIRRDPKGLYKKALAGEITDFTGVDSPFEVPENPDIIINTELVDQYNNTAHILCKVREMMWAPQAKI